MLAKTQQDLMLQSLKRRSVFTRDQPVKVSSIQQIPEWFLIGSHIGKYTTQQFKLTDQHMGLTNYMYFHNLRVSLATGLLPFVSKIHAKDPSKLQG